MKLKMTCITLSCLCALAGCYTKKVEKQETVPPVVIQQKPDRNVIIHEHPDVHERTTETVTERSY